MFLYIRKGIGVTMCYVDPKFDTYSLDMCAQYGILTSDPCLYLKGTPSPYLQNFYPKYGYNLQNDTFCTPKKKTNWGKILSIGLIQKSKIENKKSFLHSQLE